MDVFQLPSIFFKKRVRGNDYKIKKRSNPEIASCLIIFLLIGYCVCLCKREVSVCDKMI